MPSKINNEALITAQEAMIRAKLASLLASGQVPDLKWKSKYENGMILMQCVSCQEWKERTPRYFQVVMTGNFQKARVGRECLYNSKSVPCRDCRGQLQHKRMQTPCVYIEHLDRIGISG